MGWLDRIMLGAPWPPGRIAQISQVSVDIVRLEVCGMGKDEPLHSIESRIGPASDYFARRRGVLQYDQLGLTLSLSKSGRLCGFFVQVREAADSYPPDAPRIRSRLADYAGRWEPDLGQPAPSREQIVSLLGPPAAQTTDEEELMLEWHRGSTFIGADFDLKQGYLTDFFVDFES